MPLYAGINLGANPRGVPSLYPKCGTVQAHFVRNIHSQNNWTYIQNHYYYYTHITALQMLPLWGSVDRSNPNNAPNSPTLCPGGGGG